MGVFFDVQRFATTISLEKNRTKVFSMDNIATDIDTSNNNVQSIAVYANTNADLGLKTVSWRLSNESSEVLSESFDLALDDDSDTLIPATFEILYSPAAIAGEALKGAVAALKNSITVIDNALNSPFSKITQFIGDLYSNLKAIYEDLKEHNWSGLLFDCLGSFADLMDKIVDKFKIVKDFPIFGLAASMASLEKTLLTAENQYKSTGTVGDDEVDDIAIDGIDLINGVVKTSAFFFPVGLLGKAAFMGVADIIAIGVKTIYLKASHKGKSIFDALFQAAFDGVYELVDDVKSFFKAKSDDYDDIRGCL